MTTNTDAGLDLTRVEFERACSLLPPEFVWGLPVTPRLVLDVAQAALLSASKPAAQMDDVRALSEGYRRGIKDAFHSVNMINANRQGRTADETCSYIVRTLAEQVNNGETPAAPAQSGEPVLSAEVVAWRDAYQSYIEATAAYNAHLAYVREHCPFGTSVDAQYQAMNEAQRKAFSLLKPMHDALVAAPQPAQTERPALEAEIARLKAIIHTPESDDFLRGVSIEAEYQRTLHGVDDTAARFDWHQWFWVAGYLLGKALGCCKTGAGNGEKAKHHLVTTAALLMNWHNVLTGKPAASVHSNSGKAFVDLIAAQPASGVDHD